MKKMFLTQFLTILLFSNVNAQIFYWTEMTSLPHSLYSPASFSLDSNIYFVSGLTSRFPLVLTNQVWQYNVNSNAWTQKNDFPGPMRYGAHAFVIGNYAYVVCGWDDSGTSTGLNDCWRYDPVADTWLQRANFSGSARYTSATFAINGNGYLTCGYLPYTNDMYSYDPIADSWTARSNFPGSPRNNPVSFVVGNNAYCGMGANSSGGNLRDFYKYDTAGDSWTQLNDFPGNGHQATYQFVLGGLAFAGMGLEYDSVSLLNSVSNKVWKYTPVSDSWTLTVDFPDSAIFEGGFASCNGNGYAGVGAKDLIYNDSTHTNTFWRFGPKSSLGSENISNTSDIMCYPNPNSGRFSINQGHKEIHKIEIHNLLGEIVFSESNIENLNQEIDLTKQTKGIYFLTMTTNEEVVSKKIIIQ